MSTPDTLMLDSLDAPEEELVMPLTEDAPPSEPAPQRERDPATGQFVPQPPAGMPDPVQAAEPPKEPEPVKDKDEPKTVPLPVLLEERRTAREQIQRLEARLAALEKPAQAPEPEPEPDFVEDPKGYIDSKLSKVEQKLQPIEQRTQGLTEEQQLQHFLTQVGGIEAEYVKQTPDYYDALAHVRQARTDQLLTLFPQATPQQVQQQLRMEELQFAAQVMSQGRNPSEAAYQMAKSVYRYAPKAAPAPEVARPVVPKAPVADPSKTLGSTGSVADEADNEELSGDDTGDMIKTALAERFGRR